MLLTSRESSAQRPENLNEVLQLYESTTRRLDSLGFEAAINRYWKGGMYPEEVQTHVITMSFVKVGNRFRWRRSIVEVTPSEFPAGRDDVERYFDGDVWTAMRQEPADGNPGQGDRRPEEVVRVRFSDPAEEQQAEEIRKFQNEFRLLESTRISYGYLPGDGKQHVCDVLRQSQARLREKPELVNERETLVVQGQGPWGMHTLWLDPAAGCLPRRIQVDKRGSDLLGGKEVASIPPQGTGKGEWPPAAMREVSELIDNVVIQQVGDQFLVSGCDYRRTYTFEGGITAVERFKVKLEGLDLSPEISDEKITMNISDGTRVQIENAPAIDAEWRDGQIVKKYDRTAVNNLGDVGFRPPSEQHTARCWLLASNVALVAAIAAVQFWRRKRNPRSPGLDQKGT